MKKNKLRNVMSAVVAIMIIGTSTSLNGITAYSEVTDSEVATGSVVTSTETPTETDMITTCTDDQGIRYELDSANKTASVYRGNSSANVNIPEEITSDGQKYRVTSIAEHAFSKCKSLTNITIPSSVTSIGNNAFDSCESLTNIEIPDGVTSIGKDTFWLCRNLKSITIPSSVTSIGDGALQGCSKLNSIHIDSNNKNYSSDDVAIYNKDKTELLYVSNGQTLYTIPSSVTHIAAGAFSCCSLTNVTIPSSVISIGEDAFFSCDNLISVTIPDSVTSIGDSTFYGCDNLISVTIPNSVISIGDRAFTSCNKLKSITIPDSVTSIGSEAFQHCYSLENIKLSNSIKSIGFDTFMNCTSLKSITIPKSVNCIGDTINDRCNYINTNLYTDDGRTFLLAEPLDIGMFQSNDGVLFYKVESPKAATDTVTKDATSTATISPTAKSGDISVLMIIAMLAIGTIGMAKTRLVRK